MQVYFTASIVGRKYHLKNYLKIIELLRERKFDVISDHIINANESEIYLGTVEDRLKFHKQLEDWINSCHFMVAETSFPSISVGYEIALALSRGKPVLILFSQGRVPTLLDQYKEEKLYCEKYNRKTLPDIINDFINYAKGTNDTRFTFFITSEIAIYLKKISRKMKLPKSVYLRKLIEQDMRYHR